MLKLILAGYLTAGLLALWRVSALAKKNNLQIRNFKELDFDFNKAYPEDYFIEIGLSVFLTTSYGFLIGVIIWPMFIPSIIKGNFK